MASAKCRIFCRALFPVLLGLTLAVLPEAHPAGAISQTQIAATETQVATLENTIATEQRESAFLDQQYLAAQAKVQQFQTQVTATQNELATIRSHVKADHAWLTRAAVAAYVYNQPVSKIDSMFADSPSGSTARNQYENVAMGNIAVVVRALASQQQRLATTTNLEQSQEQQASDAANQMQTLETANEQAAAAVSTTLQEVQGTLGVQVAQYALQQAQAEAVAAQASSANASNAATAAAADAAVAVALGNLNTAEAAAAAANEAASAAGAPSAAGTGTGSGLGAFAATAAESQLGVPYVWGGETPGGGFDCSGLTQWSWHQAGIVIPRVAAAQLAAVPRVPLTGLEPGDLLFYFNLDGDHAIDHVVMYIGSGPYGSQTIIQAPYTGATVQFAPLFTDGLIAAGRP